MNPQQIRNDDLDIIRRDNQAEWGEADWTLLDDRRGDLPEFPLNVFSDDLREFLGRAAIGAGVTIGHVVVPLLSIASGLVGNSRRVKASPAWVEPLAIWVALVGNSGTGKTPGIGVTTSALVSIDRNRKEMIGALERKHETKVETAKAAHKKWLREVDDATEAGTPPPSMPPEAVKVPPFVTPRLYVSTSTIEKIAPLIRARPAGLVLIADELAGLFSTMSRYSNGSDREFWLEAWNGKPYRVERVGNTAVDLDHLLVGIVGGFQPDKVSRAFDGDNDGFYARFCFAWPDEPPYRPLSQEIEAVTPELVNALSRLIRLSEPTEDVFVPRDLPLTRDASDTFEQFRERLHGQKVGLDGREREWWSKGATQVLRLAGTIALLEWAWSAEAAELVEIGNPSMEAAITIWSEFFWPHSRACLRQVGLTKTQADARRVLLWCKRERVDEIRVLEARRDALGQTLDAKQTEDLLDTLTNRGWLRKCTTQTRGRPLHRWTVNPILNAGIQ